MWILFFVISFYKFGYIRILPSKRRKKKKQGVVRMAVGVLDCKLDRNHHFAVTLVCA